MERLEKLRQKRAQAAARMREILDAATDDNGEARDLTEEETAEFDGLQAEIDKVKPEITRLEALAAEEAELDEIEPGAGRRSGTRHIPPGPEAKKEFESLGEFMYAVRFNPDDQRLEYHEEVGVQSANDQSMETGDQGGFAVPTQYRNEMRQVSPQEAIIRPRAEVIEPGFPPDAAMSLTALDQTDDDNSTPDNVYGGVTVDWIEEGGEKPQSDADLRNIILQPHEVAGHIKVTDKLLRNWPAASSFLQRQLRGAVISAEEHKFMSGVGVGAPLGITRAGAAYTVNRGTATEFDHTDATNMLARVLMRGGSPCWIMSQSVMPQLLTMRNEVGSPAVGDGSLVWDPDKRDANGDQVFMGYPIKWHERSAALGSKGDVVLADLSYYLIKDGSGPFVATSEHVHFTSNRTVIKIFWNVDGQPWLTEPFVQEGGYQVSPFVVLDVPS